SVAEFPICPFFAPFHMVLFYSEKLRLLLRNSTWNTSGKARQLRKEVAVRLFSFFQDQCFLVKCPCRLNCGIARTCLHCRLWSAARSPARVTTLRRLLGRRRAHVAQSISSSGLRFPQAANNTVEG